MIGAIHTNREWIGEWRTPFLLGFDIALSYVFFLGLITLVYVYGLIKRKEDLKTLDFTQFLIIFSSMVIGMFLSLNISLTASSQPRGKCK